jgi:Zn-dependent peptidase ImmA (M78 family)
LNIITELVDLPCSIKGFTVKNPDDSFTIFINSKLNDEQQRDAYMHEFGHIVNGDFDKESADEIEMISHGFRVNFAHEFVF